MSKKVYANGLEISGKATDHMCIAAMPDVCMSPPSPPAGPIPIPYPNTSKSKDLKRGSKSVLIGNESVCLESKSHYKSSPLGDEASTKTFGANVIDHSNAGNTHCQAFSMDVTIEGEPVTRTGDLTTSNHSSTQPSGGAMTSQLAGVAPPSVDDQDDKCPCCKGPKHANQKGDGVKVTTEEEWYGPDGYADALSARELGCECVPAEPDEGCGTYFVQPDPVRSQRARQRWNGRYKRDYVNNWNKAGKRPELVYESDPKAEGDKIAHKTPISAGGCIKNEKNLMPNKAMSPECQKMDERLSEHHNARAEHFQA